LGAARESASEICGTGQPVILAEVQTLNNGAKLIYQDGASRGIAVVVTDAWISALALRSALARKRNQDGLIEVDRRGPAFTKNRRGDAIEEVQCANTKLGVAHTSKGAVRTISRSARGLYQIIEEA
jgi:hypothetical protein